MPIYEYKCEKCNHELELIQKLSDEPLVICPECKKKSLKKILSVGSFRINGKGVYKPTSKLD